MGEERREAWKGRVGGWMVLERIGEWALEERREIGGCRRYGRWVMDRE